MKFLRAVYWMIVGSWLTVCGALWFDKTEGGGMPVVLGQLSEVYLRFGIAAWSWPDPITPENIVRLLPFDEGGLEVAEAADALYGTVVTAPLVKRLSRLSPTGPAGDTTPPPSEDGPTPRKPSRRSSPSTSEDGSMSEVPAP